MSIISLKPNLSSLSQMTEINTGRPAAETRAFFWGNIGHEPGIGENPPVKYNGYGTRYIVNLRDGDQAFVGEGFVDTAQKITDYQSWLLRGQNLIRPEDIHPMNYEDPITSLEKLGGVGKDSVLRPDGPGSGQILPFMHSPESFIFASATNLATDAQNMIPVDFVNNKGYALKSMEQFGIPVPMGNSPKTIEQALEIFDELKSRGAPAVFFKLSRSAAGLGIWRVKTKNELEDLLNDPHIQHHMQHPELGVRMDYALNLRSQNNSPNIMIYVGPKETLFMGASYQILDCKPGHKTPSIHVGNTGPTSPVDEIKMIQLAYEIGEWMRLHGAYGMAGIDCVITDNDHGFANSRPSMRNVAAVEINYRINGNTGALMLMNDLGFPFWGVRNTLKVGPNFDISRFHAALESLNADYNPVRGGVVLASANSAIDLGAGTVQVYFGAHTPELRDYYSKAAVRAGLSL